MLMSAIHVHVDIDGNVNINVSVDIAETYVLLIAFRFLSSVITFHLVFAMINIRATRTLTVDRTRQAGPVNHLNI